MAANLQLVISAVDHASGVLGDIDKKAGGLSGTLGNVLKAGAVGAGVAIVGLGGFLIKSVQEAAEAQKGIAQLESVLASTGGAAGLTKQEMLDMATAFSKVTTFSDDAVLSAENLLLTFTNIRGPQVEGATQAVLDMAQAMGTDLNTAAIQVGKALNDPIAGVGALRRVGVQLSDTQEQQIKDFLAVGDAASAQKVILAELSKEFGGSAARAADTFGGRIKQLQNAFGEIQEAIGMALLPIITELAKELAEFLTAHQDDIERMAKQFVAWAQSEAWPALKDIFNTFKDDILPVLVDAFEELRDAIQTISPIVEKVFNYFKENEVALYALIAALAVLAISFGGPVTGILGIIAIGTLLLSNWDAIKAKATELWQTVVERVNGIIETVKGIPIIGEIFKGALEAVKVLVEFYWSFYSTLIGTYINVIKNTIQLVLALIRGDWDRAWQEVKQIVDTVWSGIKGIIDSFLGLIQGGLRVGLDVVKGIFGDTWTAIKGAVITAMNGVIGTVEGGVNKVIEAIRGLFQHVKNVADAFPGPNPLGNAMQAAIDGMSSITLGRIPQAGEEGSRLGQSVVDGVIVGINARTPDMVLAASRAADQVTGQMKRVWEVQSPSKVMRRIGEELTKGLQLGMGAPALMLPKIPALAGAFNIAAPPRLATAVAAGPSLQGGNTYYITIPLEYHGESSMAETERMRDRLLADLRASLNHEGLG